MSYPIETIRHSLAHVMAAAVQKLYPMLNSQVARRLKTGFITILILNTDFPKKTLKKLNTKCVR